MPKYFFIYFQRSDYNLIAWTQNHITEPTTDTFDLSPQFDALFRMCFHYQIWKTRAKDLSKTKTSTYSWSSAKSRDNISRKCHSFFQENYFHWVQTLILNVVVSLRMKSMIKMTVKVSGLQIRRNSDKTWNRIAVIQKLTTHMEEIEVKVQNFVCIGSVKLLQSLRSFDSFLLNNITYLKTVPKCTVS